MLEVEDFSQRGDAPALAIIQDNTRARALRQVVETQEELTRIHDRVTRTIDAYELGEKLSGHQLNEKEVERIADDYIRQQATLEFVDDMTQLLVILSDPVAKRKYQQQVAVFIVGFENLCGRRARLLAQLQEFFMQNGRGEEQFEVEPADFDIEDVGAQVRDALDKAEKATKKLAAVSKDVMKALELANPKETKKGKKKLEKTLQQSHQDIVSLTEKLIRVQHDLEESEGKMSQMYKSMEMKQVEIERLKVQAENGKKAAETVKELKADLSTKETEIQKSNKVIQDLELSVAHLEDKQERDYERHKKVRDENQKSKEMLEEKIRDQQQYIADVRSELKTHYDEQVKELMTSHETEMVQIKEDHKLETSRMQKALDVARKKSEELKAELSESSKRSSMTGESGSKRNSLFSPENADGETPRKLSLKSSAQAIRFMNKNKMSDVGTSSEQSDSTSSPLSKSGTILSEATNTTAENNQQVATESKTQKVTTGISHKDSKHEKTKGILKEKATKGTPEKSRKSKSTEKPKAVVEPFGNQEERLNTQQATEESRHQESQGVSIVQMVDASVQSDNDDFSDAEMHSVPQREFALQTVPEEKHEDTELESLPEENLIEKMEEYKMKAQERQSKLEYELAELKNKYILKTNSLKKQNEESQKAYLKDKEELLAKIAEAEVLKEQAEKEAEQAVLQLEEVLSEQEEMRQLREKALTNRQEGQTMTGLSLHDRHEEETMTSASLTNMREQQTMTSMSLGTDQVLDTSNPLKEEEEAATRPEDQVLSRGLSARDSGFEGAASSLRFDSRPSTSTVIPLKRHSDEKPVEQFKLTLPDRSTAMSARARRRLVNSALNKHPVAQETLRTYQAVLQFRSGMVQWLDSEGFADDASTVASVKPVALNMEDNMQVIESLPDIRSNISKVLSQLGSIISRKHLQSNKVAQSDIAAKTVGLATSSQSVEDPSMRFEGNAKEAAVMETNYVKLLKEYNDLAEGYGRLQQHLDEETKFHQEQTSQNVALMTEMQETIEQLRNQLTDLRAARSAASSGRTSSSIMFTRMDAERNGKILKRALNEKRLSESSFSAIMENMSSYVSLPAKRLVHIVERYSHHRSMKDIEMNLKQSGCLNESVFSSLERMESLQNKRAQRWGDKMDYLTNERERLAEHLTASLETIEYETGIFLIKPVYSLRARHDVNAAYGVSQRHKPSAMKAKPSSPTTPAPTPWLHQLNKVPISAGLYRDHTQSSMGRVTFSVPAGALENGPKSMNAAQPVEKQTLLSCSSGEVWQAPRSQVTGSAPTSVQLTTPRILELDINRMMISQTDMSKDISPVGVNGELTGDSVVRHYVTVHRPSGRKQSRIGSDPSCSHSPPNTAYDSKTDRPLSGSSLSQYSPLPPIHMPRLRQESRSGKSIDSENITHSTPASPDPRPGTQGSVDRPDAHSELFSPEVT